jgi:hypothetical protein
MIITAARRFPKAAAQFPDFDLATIPADLPEDFADRSWRNEPCPSLFSEARQMVLYIDYPDAADRDQPEASRYSLNRADHTGAVVSLIVDSEDWSAIVGALATAKMRLAVPAVAEDEDLDADAKTGFEAFAAGTALADWPPGQVRGWWLAYARCYGQGVKAGIAYAAGSQALSPYPQFSTAWEAWASGHDARDDL